MHFSIKAHAKINLSLKVLGKREDGYHEIETIMQTLALHDLLTFTSAPEIQLTVKGDAPAGRENLVYQAVEVLKEYTGCHEGATIILEKNIPTAAGLAGGSADAAATLRGLNRLWNLKLGLEEMLTLAAQLGSDVPFCLLGGTMLATGRGEQLTMLPPAPVMGVVLVKPDFGVSTATVYQKFDQAKLSRRPDTQVMVKALAQGDVTALAVEMVNDLEYVTLEIFPQLQKIKAVMKLAGASGVLMSGSGPTVFGLVPNEKEAWAVAQKLCWPEAKILVTSTCQPDIE